MTERTDSTLPSTYDHLMMRRRPTDLARHLTREHGASPKPARKGYEGEALRGQHDRLHRGGISGFMRDLPSSHTAWRK